MNQQANVIHLQQQPTQEARSALDEIVREGARRMLQAAIEEEVAAYIEVHENLRDEHGHRLVVRNGHMPEREVLTGAGRIAVLVASEQAAGRYEVAFEAGALPSGVYFYRLEAGVFREVRQMLLLR